MKHLKILFAITICILLNGCKDKPISDLIDIDEWNLVTMQSLNEKLHLDTILKYNKEVPPLLADDNKTIVRDYEHEILLKLSFREKIMKIFQEQQILSNEKSICIREHQGYTVEGYVQSFTLFEEENAKYHLKYNRDTDSFRITILNYHADYLDEYVFYSEIENGRLIGLEIFTLIKKVGKNKLSYEIIGITAK